ncbi:hypothetical protein ENSA5_57820 [Enhygromyxa salina]|uniref:Uncharacterized protein n=1 Tax=Enhygromyxa salina TaxID=215803 RepID=A0A2S9XE78_9BACT|nr:CFI-box-CTERM domain-containing protein [Enhygromyxa salina]PRP91165.1 hypothetical protein ENSA5_57820 [Enhygromyxa salina]
MVKTHDGEINRASWPMLSSARRMAGRGNNHGRAGRRSLLALGLVFVGPPAGAAPEADAEPAPEPASDAPDSALLEFHLDPVADLQIAIWLEDSEGNFLEDVYVTQATGKLGIGNRPGLPLFLSSWHAPYGPREGVLPVWAHRRGASYPKIVFHDSSPTDQDSQGFHESTSSPETYFCRPLRPDEDDAIVDVMTCPSPASFNSDKGKFLAGERSVYPPRADLTSVHDKDSSDVGLYAGLNELDAVTHATPIAGPYRVSHRLERDAVPEGPLVAWIEVSRERDENPDWAFDREGDHTLDSSPALQQFGREFLGQPAVVFRVEFDPAELGYAATIDYAGYSDLYGASGTLAPADATISTSGGSGADRLRIHDTHGITGRFGVYSHGWGSGADGGGTACSEYTPPRVEGLRLDALAFDTVRASFRVPEGVEPATIHAHWITPETTDFQLAAAVEAAGVPRVCSSASEPDCVEAGPGDEVVVDIDQLFGNYSYTVAISYEDSCTNRSELAIADVTTPVQPFQTIDTACFVATAAWGAGWTEELRALRWLRDAYMVDQPIAADLVRSYYAYGPTLAAMIREVPPARAAARLLLRPVARVARRVSPAGSG